MRFELLPVTLLLATACAPARSEPAATATTSAEPVAAEDRDLAIDQQLTEAEAVHEKDPERAAHMASGPCRSAVSSKTKSRCFNLGVLVK
jgi:hypothetical protein